MPPVTVLAVLIWVLAILLLAFGCFLPALLAAVFGTLIYIARNARGRSSRDGGYAADAGASSWPSSDGDGNRDVCDAGDSGNDGGDCGGGGDGGGD